MLFLQRKIDREWPVKGLKVGPGLALGRAQPGRRKAMKAVLLTNHGGPEMLRYGDAPDPVAGQGEVVVDIDAGSVNAADYKVRLGGGRDSLGRLPHILGRDFSGVVSAVGAGVTDIAIGDAVFGVKLGLTAPRQRAGQIVTT